MERTVRRICKDCRHYQKGGVRMLHGVQLNDYVCGNPDSSVYSCWVVWNDGCEDWEPRDGDPYPENTDE